MVGKNKLCSTSLRLWSSGGGEQKSKIITARNTLEVQVPVGRYDGTFKEDFFEEVIFDLRYERQTSITKGRDGIGTFKGV